MGKHKTRLPYGTYGNMRAEWLAQNRPDEYNQLKKSRKLEAYLQEWQDKYGAYSDKLYHRLKRYMGITDELKQFSYPMYLIRLGELELKIAEICRRHIEK
jgi:hypothetical protein